MGSVGLARPLLCETAAAAAILVGGTELNKKRRMVQFVRVDVYIGLGLVIYQPIRKCISLSPILLGATVTPGPYYMLLASNDF